jgi:hypothetical protein
MWLEVLNNIKNRKKAIKILEPFQTSPDEAIEKVTPMKKMNKIFGKSLKIRQVDAGSCNACEWECTALTNLVYDVHQYYKGRGNERKLPFPNSLSTHILPP